MTMAYCFEKSSLWVTDDLGAKEDAEMLFIALQDISVNCEILTDVVARRCRRHRHQVVVQYFNLFDEDLEAALLERVAGVMCRGLIAALTPRHITLACQALLSIRFKDIITLLEIFCDIDKILYERIVKYCNREFRLDLDMELRVNTDLFYHTLIKWLVERTHDTTLVNMSEADEPMDMFVYIRHLVSNFEKQEQYHVEEAIYNEFTGLMQYALITIVHIVRDRPGFVAQQIHDCIVGMGSSGRLIRLIVTQKESDFRLVKQAFQEKYNLSLAHFLKREVEDTFSQFLVALTDAEATDGLEEE